MSLAAFHPRPFLFAAAVLLAGCLVPSQEEVVGGKSCDEDGGHPCAPDHLCCRGTCIGPAESCCQPETDAELCARMGTTCGPVSTSDRCGGTRTVSCPETDAAFCARHGKQCGTYTGADLCAQQRTAGCGTCSTPPNTTCSLNTCVCTPDTTAQLCARLGVQCGPATGMDNCGTVRTVICPACSSPSTCGGAGSPGQCGCIAVGSTCTQGDGTTCCGGACSGNPQRCCRPLGDPCTGGISGECCQGVCDPTAGTCCRTTGFCSANWMCCSGFCDEGASQCAP